MSKYLPFMVYENVLEFLKYRKLILVGAALEEKKFIEKIQMSGYVIVEAKDADDKQRRPNKSMHPATVGLQVKTYIAIVEPNSEVSQKSADFEKMLKDIHPIFSAKRNYNIEVILITKEELKSNITNKIATYTLTGGTKKDAAEGFILINNYTYKNFIIVVPKHIMVPPHRILSKEEEEQLLAETYTRKIDIPKITQKDPNAIWHDGQRGDIFEILVPSENSGTEIHYRCVI